MTHDLEVVPACDDVIKCGVPRRFLHFRTELEASNGYLCRDCHLHSVLLLLGICLASGVLVGDFLDLPHKANLSTSLNTFRLSICAVIVMHW